MSGAMPSIGEELSPFEIDGFTSHHVARYAELSGDRNPIHTDVTAARTVGLASCTVHGMLIVGQFEGMIKKWRADAWLAATSTRFVRPLLVEERFRITGRIVAQDVTAPSDLVVRLVVRNGSDQIICLSDARVHIEP
jgi:acyl dehydratase